MPSSLRPVVFPLFAIVDGKCACGKDDCKRVGKHPKVAWGELKAGDEVPERKPGEGVGLKTGAAPKGSDCVVVDLDNEAALEAFEALGGADVTFAVATPRGWHLYFQHPGFHVKNSASEIAPGVDIRGDGGFVVAPGSPHKSGGKYEAIDPQAELAPLPEWLLAWLQRQPKATEVQHYPGDVEEGPEREYRKGLYVQYLQAEAPARGPEYRGQGDKILFDVVQRGAYDLALPVDDVLELVREHYDPRCEPPWGDELEERVHHKAHDAKTASTRDRFEPVPHDLVLRNVDTFAEVPRERNATKAEGPILWGGWDKPIEPPVYLLEGLIPEGKVVTFFAEGGSVKTWSAFMLAICVATGRPWLGHAVKQGRALYLDFEDGRYEFQRRMRILTGGIEDIPELGYWYGAPYLDKLDTWKAIAPLGLKLVVIDALSSGVTGGTDENSNVFSEAVKLAGRFTEIGCTVLIIHHANKQGGIRGHSSVRDQSDVVFRFEAVSETENTKRMRMVCDKPGPQKRPPPVNVELSDAGLRTFEDTGESPAKAAPGSEITFSQAEAAVMLHLSHGPLNATKLKQRIGGRHQLVTDAIASLSQEGRIVCLNEREGYRLDDEAKRRQRIIDAARDFYGTHAELADRAMVLPSDVAAALEAKLIEERTPRKPHYGYIVNA